MNNNLPEINFAEKKEKKEKKGGFWAWLRGKLGFSSRGAMGEAGVNSSVMNVGRAIGSVKLGTASAGLSGFITSNIGTLATLAMVALAGGIYLSRNFPATLPGSAAFSIDKTGSTYIPALLRSQTANNGSSLDMLRAANKAGSYATEEPSSADSGKPEAAAQTEGKDGSDLNQPAPQPDNMQQEMMGRLQGGGMGSLTSSLGGGASKFSTMGGFSNKFGEGQIGPKIGPTSGIGAGFSTMPKFAERKGKMLALKGVSRPVLSNSKGAKSARVGPGAFGQAKALRATQQSYTGGNIDSARSTQDKAWEGSTAGGGVTSGGAGLSDGGAGIVTSPSLDNSQAGGAAGTSGATGIPDTAAVPDIGSILNVSPWAGLLAKAMMMILLSAVLSAVGAKLITQGRALMSNPLTASMGMMLYMLGMIMCVMALVMGLMATMIGMQVISTFGQMMLGSVYLLGGGVAVAGAVMAMTGTSLGPITPLWMSAIAGVIALMGSMFGV